MKIIHNAQIGDKELSLAEKQLFQIMQSLSLATTSRPSYRTSAQSILDSVN